MRTWQWAFRGLVRNPGFTTAALTTLGLGIGSAVLMFAVLHSVVLRPLPVRDPETLVFIWIDDAKRGVHEEGVSYPAYLDWRAQSQSFADLAVRGRGYSGTLTGGQAERLLIDVVSANYLPLVGIVPVSGRTFTEEEEERGALVALISERLARRRFGSPETAVGKALEIDRRIWRIIGVVPAGFAIPDAQLDVWVTAKKFPPLERFITSRTWDFFIGVGRLKPGVTHGQAQAELNAIGAGLDQTYQIHDPDFGGFGTSVVSLDEQLLGRRLPRTLWLLMGAVALVFIVSCVNTANLVLARGAARQAEFAVRAALGAGPRTLVVEQVAEATLIAVFSSGIGLALAWMGLRVLPFIAPGDLPRFDRLEISSTVVAFTGFAGLSACLLFGLIPALMEARRNTNLTHAGSGGRVMDSGSGTMQAVLVATDFALAMMLLAGAGLFLRSLLAVGSIEPGYETKGAVLFQVARAGAESREKDALFYNGLLDRLRDLPGTEAAGAITDFFIERNPDYSVTVQGRSTESREQVTVDAVAPGFLEAIGARLLRGRFLTEADYQPDPAAIVINETFVRRFFPNEDAIGKQLKFGTAESRGPWITIVGVVADLRRQGLERRPVCEAFGPVIGSNMDVVVRSQLPLERVAPMVRSAVRDLDPSVPVYGVTTLEARLEAFAADRRLQAWMLGGFSLLTLVMAAVGLYGVMQYVVSRRRRELAVRMALGAQTSRIFGIVLRRGFVQAAAGIAIGLAGALVLTRVVSSMLYGIRAFDVIALASAAGLLAVVAIGACTVPAQSAARTDPARLLRE
jgi:predicted permease